MGDAMPQSEKLHSDEFFLDYITRYGQAFDNYDLETILDYYQTPCFIFKSGILFANVIEEIKRKYFQDLLNSYRQEAYANAEIPNFELKGMGKDCMLITVEWVCKRNDGSLAFDFWASYFLIYIKGKWKILGDTVYA